MRVIGELVVNMNKKELKAWANNLYENGNCSREWLERFLNQLNNNKYE